MIYAFSGSQCLRAKHWGGNRYRKFKFNSLLLFKKKKKNSVSAPLKRAKRSLLRVTEQNRTISNLKISRGFLNPNLQNRIL